MVRCPPPADSTGRSPGRCAPVSCNRLLGCGQNESPGMRAELQLDGRHAATELTARLVESCSSSARRPSGAPPPRAPLAGAPRAWGALPRCAGTRRAPRTWLECPIVAERVVPAITLPFCGWSAGSLTPRGSAAGDVPAHSEFYDPPRAGAPANTGRSPVRAPASCNRLLGSSFCCPSECAAGQACDATMHEARTGTWRTRPSRCRAGRQESVQLWHTPGSEHQSDDAMSRVRAQELWTG